ncbi:hypothetical protein JG687_00007027 [Phytophthora cactorum]|uniref:Uncharacterized protein n=1 Tax=Phytophthora cactorum TaxID=29920 RepID=A0A8T1UHT6_9STRA|nr:hypothetical protein JG687_00007027 [Phytophthora cactorum]
MTVATVRDIFDIVLDGYDSMDGYLAPGGQCGAENTLLNGGSSFDCYVTVQCNPLTPNAKHMPLDRSGNGQWQSLTKLLPRRLANKRARASKSKASFDTL